MLERVIREGLVVIRKGIVREGSEGFFRRYLIGGNYERRVLVTGLCYYNRGVLVVTGVYYYDRGVPAGGGRVLTRLPWKAPPQSLPTPPLLAPADCCSPPVGRRRGGGGGG